MWRNIGKVPCKDRRALPIGIEKGKNDTPDWRHRSKSGEKEIVKWPNQKRRGSLRTIWRRPRFGTGKYEFLGKVYELMDFTTPSDESVQRLQAIIDEAFGRNKE